MRTINRLGWMAMIGAVALWMGCGDMGEEGEPTTGIHSLTQISVGAEADVEWMKYRVTRCDDDEVVLKARKSLKELTLPGGISSFVDNPFGEQSSHAFADYLMLLETGCYDVHVQPLRGDKSKSKKCLPMVKQEIDVVPGKTTEVLLVSQCKGKQTGALDVVAALNHPPRIRILDLDPQKFVQCPVEGNPELTVCVEAVDKDHDTIRLAWKGFEDQEGVKSAELIEGTRYSEAGVAGECWRIVFERQDGTYHFKVTAFDEFVIFKDGERKVITAEAWFEKMGYETKKGEPIRSRDSIKFPVYVAGCDEEVALICPRTRGFWQSPPVNESLVNQKWIDATGGTYDTSETLCTGHANEVRWFDILSGDPEGNMYFILAAQYIAAELNRAAGASGVEAIDDAVDGYILEALEYLEDGDACDAQGSDWDQTTRQAAEMLKNDLEGFNSLCAKGNEE